MPARTPQPKAPKLPTVPKAADSPKAPSAEKLPANLIRRQVFGERRTRIDTQNGAYNPRVFFKNGSKGNEVLTNSNGRLTNDSLENTMYSIGNLQV